MATFGKRSFRVAQLTRPADTSEVLYNGIRLPTTWPPSPGISQPDMLNEVSTAGYNPVIVPTYPGHEPASRVIRTAAGVGGRQLFVDDWLIEHSQLTRSWVTATPHPSNPVIAPDKDWEIAGSDSPGSYEGHIATPYSDGIWWDGEKYICLYQASFGKSTCYAESADGVAWTKPDLGDGTNKSLNHEPRPNPDLPCRDSASLWRDDNDIAARRWKFIYTQPMPDTGNLWRLRIVYAATPVGPWSAPVSTGYTILDRSTMWFNPFRQRWVYSLRAFDSGFANRRWRRYWETPTADLLANVYPAIVTYRWNRADDIDEQMYNDAGGIQSWTPQLYNFDVQPYESLLVGWRVMLFGDGSGSRPKLNKVMSSFSRDGFYFSNSYHLTLGDLNPTPQSWNYGNMHTVIGSPMVDRDKLRIYATGRAGIPGDTNGSMGDAGAGLFELRRDGFCKLSATGAEKTLTTKRVRFYSGTKFFINAAAAGGQVRVEAIDDRTGQPFPGFARANSSVISTDTTWSEVTWSASIATLVGEPVKFKFYAIDADLYAFGVTDNSGGSGGYTHQGRA